MNSAEMLCRIIDAPIVSSGTLRPDHLCSALLTEAEHLGLELPRDLWQPATAIAAHGHYGGVCLDLPPRLADIASYIVAELFDALTWAAPDGCYLAASEGDGALFLWHVNLEAQAEAINADPKARQEAKVIEIPDHWLIAIVNGDESVFDYYDNVDDYHSYLQFTEEELNGWHVSDYETESEFSHYHDASAYGVLPCTVVKCLALRQKI